MQESNEVTPDEFETYRKALEVFGGEVREIVKGKKIVVSFCDPDRMVRVVVGLKERTNGVVCNSKLIDGEHVLTIEKR